MRNDMHHVMGDESVELLRHTLAVAPEYFEDVVGIFGNLFDRPGLRPEQRELATVAVLTALGLDLELSQHLRGALNVGVSRSELVEVITQVALYAGHPRAINAFRVARDVFAAIDRDDRSYD